MACFVANRFLKVDIEGLTNGEEARLTRAKSHEIKRNGVASSSRHAYLNLASWMFRRQGEGKIVGWGANPKGGYGDVLHGWCCEKDGGHPRTCKEESETCTP